MFPYFPLSDDKFKMTMGVQALGGNHLIEIDPDHYHSELALKNELLTKHYTDYFRAAPGSEQMQWEVLEMVLPVLAHDYPQHFSLARDGDYWSWQNSLLGSEDTFRIGAISSFAVPPLDWLGRQVQEDLLILSGEDDMPLLAGQLCFPNSWSLEDKMGKSFLTIHHEVPLFAERIGRSSNLLLERLKAGRTVWRVNWSIKTTPQLDHLVRLSHQVQRSYGDDLIAANLSGLTLENIGERCYLRVERQTLSRLPRTHGILFTIHTYQSPLARVAANAEHAHRIAGVLRSTPAAMLDYKGITPFIDILLTYLDFYPHPA